MGQRILIGRSPQSRADERGFTLMEVLMAGLIGVIALTANLAMFNYANRDFAYSRSLTEATNIATNQLADFKTQAIDEPLVTDDILGSVTVATTAEKTADPRLASALLIGLHRENATLNNCLLPADHYGITFCRNWEVWKVDVDGDGTADMDGDIVKIRLTVNWTVGNRPHQVTMTTLTTGKPS
jgi:hypothetical protein